jgi:hypothetical protein
VNIGRHAKSSSESAGPKVETPLFYLISTQQRDVKAVRVQKTSRIDPL